MLPRREIGSGIFSYRGQFLFCDANIRRAAQSACGVSAVISICLADFDQQKAFYVNFASKLTTQLPFPKRPANLTVLVWNERDVLMVKADRQEPLTVVRMWLTDDISAAANDRQG